MKINKSLQPIKAQLSDIATQVNEITYPTKTYTLNNKADYTLSLTNWLRTYANATLTDGVLTYTATQTYGQCKQSIAQSVAGHYYWVKADIKADSPNVKIELVDQSSGVYTALAHSGSGNYEKLSGRIQINASGNLYVRVIDYRSSGYTAIEIKNVVVVDLTAAFTTREPTASDVEMMVSNANTGTIAVPGNLTVYGLTQNKAFCPLFVTKISDVIGVISKYNDTKDLGITFDHLGVNNIYQFKSFKTIPNTSNQVSNSMSNGATILTSGTDWWSPYVVKATANINGDLPASSDYTGGTHGYDGSGGGTPTGRTTGVTLFVDGRKVTTYNDYAEYIDIYWTNMIQATNTKKSAGGGREVLREDIHVHFDGYKFSTDVLITFLEAVTLSQYYGLQSTNQAWSDGVFYHGSINKQWNTFAAHSDSGDNKCGKITLYKGTDYLDFAIDKNVGIGDKSLLGSNYAARSENYLKSYFWLVGANQSMNANDMVSYEGYYRFYSKA
jgi:hypothetical protein